MVFTPWLVKPWPEGLWFGRLSLEPPMAAKTIESLRTDLARNLRSIRIKRGYAQERLGLDAGVDRTVVSKIERAAANPSLQTLLKLSNVLDVPIADFFQDGVPYPKCQRADLEDNG